MIDDVAGSVALLSGGGNGIGREIALEFARRGAAVVVNDLGTSTDGVGRSASASENVADEVMALGGRASASATDVSDEAAVQALTADIVSEFGRLDIMINTAGLIRGGDLTTYSDEEWERHQGVHIGGHLNLLHAALPAMKENGFGRILFFTSGSGLLRASSQLSAYGAGKRAIAELVWSLHRYLPPHVTLNGIAPLASSRMHAERPANRTAEVWGAPETMPDAATIAPVAAAVVQSELNGLVLYTNGAEVSVIEQPEPIETVHIPDHGARSVIDSALDSILVPSGAAGLTTGTSLPRFALDPVPRGARS